MSRSGYTLVELLVAVMILSIALLAIMSAIGVAQDTQDRAVHLAIARDIAVKHMEEYRSMGRDKVLNSLPSYSSPSLPAGNLITRSASLYPNPFASRLYRVSVMVRWPEGNGTRTITHETILYKP